jgi:ABC-type Fe3+-citrate transport system substrate-binding protein
MSTINISVLTPSDFAGEIEQFASEHAGQVTVHKKPSDKKTVEDLGFEPITTALAAAWLISFASDVGKDLVKKFIEEKIWKKLNAEPKGKLTEVQIAFPNGYVLTVRSEERFDINQLQRLIEQNT